MHGTSLMDIQIANDSKRTPNKLMGEIIARIDGLLYESIYGDYPALRKFGK
jgi:hypothetical protein